MYDLHKNRIVEVLIRKIIISITILSSLEIKIMLHALVEKWTESDARYEIFIAAFSAMLLNNYFWLKAGKHCPLIPSTLSYQGRLTRVQLGFRVYK